MCKVVNLKYEEYDVYIGRAGKGHDGYFGNPFTEADGSREEIIKLFESYARRRMLKDEDWRNNILALDGKKLGCFCKPLPCHGDILVKLCNELKEEHNRIS